VDLDPGWRLRDDPHPDARGHRKLADAIAEALVALGVGSEHADQ
jgi:lysophospholipase L1-like esterase